MKISDLSSGVTVENMFRLVDILGRGSYGDVWLADVISKDSDLPNQVAVKIYNFTQQNRSRAVLQKEADQAKTFEHENIVKVYGAKRLDSLFMLWMDYVPGKTLLDIIGADDNPQPVSLESIMCWLHDIADGLAYLHSQHPNPCVHGDLKLDNIIIDDKGKAHIIDFGQTKPICDRFVATLGVGAWPFLAPEIIAHETEKEGKRFVSSDVYAFGVIAYRFMTGRFPHRTMMEAVNQTPYPQPVDLNSKVPPVLNNLIMKCLEKKPGNRLTTGAAVLSELEKVQKVLADSDYKNIQPKQDEAGLFSTANELEALSKELMNEGKPELVIKRLDQAMERMSTSPRLLLIYAEAAKKIKKYDVSYVVFNRLIKWYQNNDYNVIDQKEAVEGIADVCIKLKKYEESVTHFQYLAETFPKKRWYRYRHAVALGISGEYSEAIPILQRLNQEEPSALICGKIGYAFYQTGDAEQAKQYFNEALMLDEYEETALFYMSEINAISGKASRALKYYQRLTNVEGEEAAERAGQLAVEFGFKN